MDYLQLDLLVAVCVALLLRYLYNRTRSSHPPLPPGPKPLPIIGNLLDLPKHEEKAWERYSKWANDYGDIVHVRAFGTSTIVLNTFKAVCDLFEKRSSIYSSRPHSVMFNELMEFGAGTAFQPYGDVWRTHRRLYHKQLNQTAAREFHPMQMEAARGLLHLILESPQDYRQHIRHMAAGTVMSVAYGHDIAPKEDPFVALAEGVTRGFSRAVRPGSYLVDLMPMLKHVPEWVPGAGFQKFARETRKSVWNAREIPFEDVKRRMAAGTARSSFVANSLTELGTSEESQKDVDIIKGVAGSIYAGLFECSWIRYRRSPQTVSTVHSFILAMILYPDVQRAAQAELDSIVGQERLPQLSDRDHLPYMAAVAKEVLRWLPVAPTALPHVTTEDDVYQEYYIPKGAIVMGNAWNILHDPEVYLDPFTFRPERFLPNKDGRVERDPATTGAFGFGRRLCAGRHFAEASIWIAAASLLAAFNITNAVDEHGRDIDVSYAMNPRPGFFNHPQPFKCSIKPRSKETETLIRRTQQI